MSMGYKCSCGILWASDQGRIDCEKSHVSPRIAPRRPKARTQGDQALEKIREAITKYIAGDRSDVEMATALGAIAFWAWEGAGHPDPSPSFTANHP